MAQICSTWRRVLTAVDATTPSAASLATTLHWLGSWRDELNLSARERSLLKGGLISLDRQLQRLQQQQLRVAVFGRVGVGKSSLINALVGRDVLATDVAHGSTRHQRAVVWPHGIAGLGTVELVDTPGIDEVFAPARARLAARVALQAELVLFVLDGDISRVELEALDALLACGKPVQTVLNRSDAWSEEDRAALLVSLSTRIRHHCGAEAGRCVHTALTVAAAPREATQLSDGRVRSQARAPQIHPLRSALGSLLTDHGQALLTLNVLRQAERLQHQIEAGRLRCRRREAQGLIGRFAALKATGVAVNPLALLDLAGGMACDTALVIQLCQLYDLPMGGPAARRLLQRLSGHNALIGGVQLGIQATLSGLRQLLLAAAPFTAGLSLAPAAPVALAQAALAVHTTQRTGRLTARWLLEQRGRGRRSRPVPSSVLRRLAGSDRQLHRLLQDWPNHPQAADLSDVMP